MQFTTDRAWKYGFNGCLLWCKDTNFNAIHNSDYLSSNKPLAVYYGAKILILMQFTTNADIDTPL